MKEMDFVLLLLSTRKLKKLAHNIAMQIAAMNPIAIDEDGVLNL